MDDFSININNKNNTIKFRSLGGWFHKDFSQEQIKEINSKIQGQGYKMTKQGESYFVKKIEQQQSKHGGPSLHIN